MTRSAGAKAFAVDVAVAFNNKQSNSTRAAEQAPLYVSQTSAPTSLDDQPSAAKKRFSLDQPLPAITSHSAVEKRLARTTVDGLSALFSVEVAVAFINKQIECR